MERIEITQATASYEKWLEKFLPVLQDDLKLKHQHMADDAFMFLRATFYRWMQLWDEVGSEFKDDPKPYAIGDLHIENFGTWRDLDGRLIWGINDFDESYPLPFAVDLVRLGVSAHLAIREGKFSVSMDDAVQAILNGYERGLLKPAPFVLEEHHGWLRKIALSEMRSPELFWQKIEALPIAHGAYLHSAKKALKKHLPASHLDPVFLRRTAGLGSLGRPRVVALAEWGRGFICREAKSIAPSACVWARGSRKWPKPYIATTLAHAARVSDPCVALEKKWFVRRLAPHCSKIDIGFLPKKRDELNLLEAMGFETANIHSGSVNPQKITRLITRKKRRAICAAIENMMDLTLSDWKEWKAHQRRRI